jgi:uncharacterized alkaline shock family protein YloU
MTQQTPPTRSGKPEAERPDTEPTKSSSVVRTDQDRQGSDRGTTTIDDAVIAKIAGMAAREVNGMAGLGGAVSGALADMVGRIRGDEHATSGVGVEVGTRQAAVDLVIKVQYPAAVHEVAASVRENVIDRIEGMTGLEVVEVNIVVTDLSFGQDDEDAEDADRRVE